MSRNRLFRIRQRFRDNALDDPEGSVRQQLVRLNDLIRPGARIAIAVGSRGIHRLALVVKEVGDFLKRCGAEPFVVPAMGSHGGATAEGQAEILRLYGVSRDLIGIPVRSSPEVVELPRGPLHNRIFMDRHAYASDGVILINRIKPHTDYHGTCESGLMKMAVIGLGKRPGALAVHRLGVRGLRELIAPSARRVLEGGKILGGVGLVENARHELMQVRVLRADEIAAEEPTLLETARENMPSLPVKAIDVLVIDRMGKDISGIGIDSNITGRIGIRGQDEPANPQVRAVMVSDLTAESRGNAIGVGLADVITRRLCDKIDRRETYANVVTSGFLERGKIPVVADSDRQAFEIALGTCGNTSAGEERIIRIRDTLHLEEVLVSRAVAAEMTDPGRFEMVRADVDLFDVSGTLTPF
jgi:hypothetical protein